MRLLFPTLLLPAAALAGSGFDGMWQMRWNGQSYDAKFDGKEYPVAGDPGNTTVSLKKIDDVTVEETDHRQGTVINQIRLSLAKDGNTITVIDQDIAHGQTVTYTLEKLH